MINKEGLKTWSCANLQTFLSILKNLMIVRMDSRHTSDINSHLLRVRIYVVIDNDVLQFPFIVDIAESLLCRRQTEHRI